MKVITHKRNGIEKEKEINAVGNYRFISEGVEFYSENWDRRKSVTSVVVPTKECLTVALKMVRELEIATGSKWGVFEDNGKGWAKK